MDYLKLFILCSFLSILLGACATNTDSSVQLDLEGTFGNASLTPRKVFELKIEGEYIYAGTDNNLHRKSLSEADWGSLGLIDGEVRTFTVFTKTEFIASVHYSKIDSGTIAKTTNEGENWLPFRNGFGGELEVIPISMEASPQEKKILYARGLMNVAKSVNGGKNWESIYWAWDTIGSAKFIETDTNNPDIIWAGGSTATFAPHLIKSTDGGETWQRLKILENVETTVYDVVIHPSEHVRILAGLGGGIRKSTDGGGNWRTVLEGMYVYTLISSPQDGRMVYAAGETADGTLGFWASGDFGDTWEEVGMANSPAGLQVNDMVSVMQGGHEVLYLGTNRGVYSYTFAE